MFMLLTYDVEAKRTEKFKKLMRRQNVEVCKLTKSDVGKGEIKRIPIDDHRRDFAVL